jgi:P-type conjugative transfer protein TrbG
MKRLFSVLIVGILHGQEAQTPMLKRTPPPAVAVVKKDIVAVKKSFAAPAKQPDVRIDLVMPAPEPDKSVLEAIRLGMTVREEPAVPVRGQYGSLVYTYGRGEPVMVCAPLHVCFIELQPGERSNGDLSIGDSVRWDISPGLYGGQEEGSQVVVLKPHDANLETNMLIATNRRIYYVRLVSRPGDYVARVAFRYPEDDAKAWAQKVAAAVPPPAPETKILPAILSVERLNFNYSIKGGNEHIRPTKVYDDASKTFFTMPAEMQHREAPTLLVVGEDGKPVMSNYRVQNGTYILDRLIDRAQLVIGSGKKAKRVEITRENRG